MIGSKLNVNSITGSALRLRYGQFWISPSGGSRLGECEGLKMLNRLVLVSVAVVVVACADDEQSTDDLELATVKEWVSDTPSDAPADVHNVAPVSDMLGGLEARLQQNPNDVKGWTLLAQSYAHVGRMSDAREAADKAVELGASRDRLDDKIMAAHTGVLD